MVYHAPWWGACIALIADIAATGKEMHLSSRLWVQWSEKKKTGTALQCVCDIDLPCRKQRIY